VGGGKWGKKKWGGGGGKNGEDIIMWVGYKKGIKKINEDKEKCERFFGVVWY
jgi:hypothetical protein